MKCLSPISIKNPKYRKEDFRPFRISSDGEILGERIDDTQLLVPCGTCFACLKNKRNSLAFRLAQETYHSNKAYFITLTVNDDYMSLFKDDPKKVFRQWFEQLRYKYGTSPRHFIISELGSKTKRLHFHGIIWNPCFSEKEFSILWKYGFSYVGYVNDKTINYIAKYITKPQLDDPDYKPIVLQSNRPGIGSSYLTQSVKDSFRKTEDFTVYFGKARIQLPRYYFDKIFTPEERRKKAIQYQQQLLDNPFNYVFNLLRRSKCCSIEHYLNTVKDHYEQSLNLGQSKPKYKQLNQSFYGFVKTNDDSSTTERVKL